MKYGFIVDFEDAVLDEKGRVKEVHVRYDPETRSGQDQSGRRVKGAIHWVYAESAQALFCAIADFLGMFFGYDFTGQFWTPYLFGAIGGGCQSLGKN